MIGLLLLKTHPANTQELIDALRSIQTAPPAATPEPEPMPTPVSGGGPVPPGDIATRFGNPPADVADAIKRHWPQVQWVHAAEVSYMESGWRNTAELNTLDKGPCGTRYFFSAEVGYAQTEDSVGIFQINICAHGGTRDYWYDPENNARKGAELFASVGWSPWTVSARRLGLL